jgi:dienelactone hydrolase
MSPTCLVRALSAACLTATCVIAGNLPPANAAGVQKQTHRIDTGSDRIEVDFYYLPGSVPKPVAVVSHGFLGNRHRMAAWGRRLAADGFLVAVPTNPAIVSIDRNVSSLRFLLTRGSQSRWPIPVVSNGQTVLIGFSKGGLETLLVAASHAVPLQAWVGLDPVDRDQRGSVAARQVQVPGLAILAAPSPMNAYGNARAMLACYAGPLQIKRVPGARHVEAESPDWPADPNTFQRFASEVSRFLKTTLNAPTAPPLPNALKIGDFPQP